MAEAFLTYHPIFRVTKIFKTTEFQRQTMVHGLSIMEGVLV